MTYLSIGLNSSTTKDAGMKDRWKLLISLVAPLLVGFTAGFFTQTGQWYAELAKPALTPPNAVFGPVWTVLYLLMGVSLYLVWKRGFEENSLYYFAGQLVLNGIWSFLFFGLQAPVIAFVEIVVLVTALGLTINSFRKIDRTAAYLLAPYLLWTLFAGYLNLGIVLLT